MAKIERSHNSTQKLKIILRLNSILTGLLVAVGSVFFVSAFATEGSRFDFYEYCFRPHTFTNPKSSDKYCTLDKRYKGVTWLVALERENNPELNKLTFIKGIKATRPYSGWFGLSSAGCFFLAYLFWQDGSNYYVGILSSIIRDEEKEIIERAVLAENELSLLTLSETHNREYTEDKLNRQQATRLYLSKEPHEIQLLAEQYQKQKQIEELAFQLKQEEIQAETAEQQKRRWEASLDALKAKTKLEGSVWDEESSDSPTDKESLKKFLKSHEDGWLWELVCNRKPLWLIGGQGSGKSSFASALVLCRLLFNEWKIVSVCDPQYHQNSKKNKPWSYLSPYKPDVYGLHDDGSGFNWESIGQAMTSAFTRWSERDESMQPVQSIWDEVTNYSANVPLSEQWALRLNSDPRKSGEACIMLAHGKSKLVTGGGEGLKEAKEENCLFIRLGCNNSQEPTFKGHIEGWKNLEGDLIPEKPITVPKEWFNPTCISKIMPKVTK